jgi:hypothetical protein
MSAASAEAGGHRAMRTEDVLRHRRHVEVRTVRATDAKCCHPNRHDLRRRRLHALQGKADLGADLKSNDDASAGFVRMRAGGTSIARRRTAPCLWRNEFIGRSVNHDPDLPRRVRVPAIAKSGRKRMCIDSVCHAPASSDSAALATG